MRRQHSFLVRRRRAEAKSLLFFPDYRDGDAYQSLLYSELPSVGFHAEPVTVHQLDDELRRRADLSDPGVFNLQWTAQLIQKADDALSARHRRGKFQSAIDAFLDAGGRMIWTIHNVLPHELVHREDEIEFHRFLARRASAVHVLSRATIEAVEPHYSLDPAKVHVIENSSYGGSYPNDVARAQARVMLGLGAADVVLAAVGRIRPYKGHRHLVGWFVSPAAEDPGLRLLVAGHVGELPRVDELIAQLDHPRIVARLGHVPDEDLQVWYRAADLAVLPYTAILNSGAFWLAITFGIPVVAPRLGALVAFEGLPFVRMFDPDDPHDLGRVITAARAELVDPTRPEQWRTQIESFAAEHGPRPMGRRFADLVVAEAARTGSRHRA